MPRVDGSSRGDLQITTLPTPEVRRQLGGVGTPGLTILWHPEPSRVGETALLAGLISGASDEVSRVRPYFAPPNGGTPRPLSDPHLSREPLVLHSTADGGVRLDPSSKGATVRAGAIPVTEPTDCPRSDLEAGIVLLLNHCAVVLLHLLTPPGPRLPSFGLVGESAATLQLRGEIQRLRDLDYPVLLTGETGTGKELVARALHDFGPRRKQPFVAVNVGAIAPTLAGSELFGAVKGAFTDASRSRQGHFQAADGGTLFLDEIGEAPADVQVMLLRVLERGRVRAVGSSVATPVDVRLISATDADLEAMIDVGVFREPLLHRLAVCELELPPLRRRRDDIGRLFLHFLRQELDEIGESALSSRQGEEPWIPAELVARLAAFSWSGNVRQLRNVVRRLVVASMGEERMQPPPRVEQMLAEPTIPEPSPAGVAPSERKHYRRRKDVAQEEIAQALCENNWRVSAAAKTLGVSRTSLYRLIRESGTIRKASDLGRAELSEAIQKSRGRLAEMVEMLKVSERGLKLRMSELGLRVGSARKTKSSEGDSGALEFEQD